MTPSFVFNGNNFSLGKRKSPPLAASISALYASKCLDKLSSVKILSRLPKLSLNASNVNFIVCPSSINSTLPSTCESVIMSVFVFQLAGMSSKEI